MPADPGDFDYPAAFAYSQGADPVDVAVKSAATEINAWLSVRDGRAVSPASFPGYVIDLTPEALARVVVGKLLGCGWTPPEVPGTTATEGPE